MIEQMLSVSEAAKILNIAAVTLRQMTWRSEIAHVRIGRRVLLRESDLREFIDKNTKPVRFK